MNNFCTTFSRSLELDFIQYEQWPIVKLLVRSVRLSCVGGLPKSLGHFLLTLFFISCRRSIWNNSARRPDRMCPRALVIPKTEIWLLRAELSRVPLIFPSMNFMTMSSMATWTRKHFFCQLQCPANLRNGRPFLIHVLFSIVWVK